mmetsp:Transcript_13869/g.15192  ORF Transcript_13869/g.15192 Transcript_13869/m.15192 type:complete len:207 (-) Transcript_13869:139-759(-)
MPPQLPFHQNISFLSSIHHLSLFLLCMYDELHVYVAYDSSLTGTVLFGHLNIVKRIIYRYIYYSFPRLISIFAVSIIAIATTIATVSTSTVATAIAAVSTTVTTVSTTVTSVATTVSTASVATAVSTVSAAVSAASVSVSTTVTTVATAVATSVATTVSTTVSSTVSAVATAVAITPSSQNDNPVGGDTTVSAVSTTSVPGTVAIR